MSDEIYFGLVIIAVMIVGVALFWPDGGNK